MDYYGIEVGGVYEEDVCGLPTIVILVPCVQASRSYGSSSAPLQAGSKLTFVSNADSENEPGGTQLSRKVQHPADGYTASVLYGIKATASKGLPLLSRQDRKTIQPRGSRSHFIISCHVAPTHLSALAWRRPGDSSR
ncbi:unnamed protein product [Arctogadus glacialis]